MRIVKPGADECGLMEQRGDRRFRREMCRRTRRIDAFLRNSRCGDACRGGIATAHLQRVLAEPPSFSLRVGMGDAARCPSCTAARDAAAAGTCGVADRRREGDLECGGHLLRSECRLERSALRRRPHAYKSRPRRCRRPIDECADRRGASLDAARGRTDLPTVLARPVGHRQDHHHVHDAERFQAHPGRLRGADAGRQGLRHRERVFRQDVRARPRLRALDSMGR